MIRIIYVVIRDFVIIDQCLDAERQKLMHTTLFIALFVEENRQMETKHSLKDTQDYTMPQTNEKRWANLKFLSQKHDVAHFRAKLYFGRRRKQVRFAHLRSKKRPETQGIGFIGISDVSHLFYKTF